MKIGRRRFIEYGAILSLGAGAAYLGYSQLSKGISSPSLTSTATSAGTSTDSANLSPAYSQFLAWLASVSKPYTGRTIDVSLQYEPTPLAIQAIDPQFFNATGINVNYGIKPYLLHLSDISIMVRTASPTYDVFDTDYQDVYSFKDHVLSPTDLAEKYPDLTYSRFNPDDFQKTAWSLLASYPPLGLAAPSVGSTNGRILFIPFDMDVMIDYYRKDVFESAGITSIPSTWDEYFDNVKALNNNPLVQFGTVNQAAPNVAVIFEFLNHLTSFGGKLWNYDGEQLTSALDSPEALAALENYVRFNPYSEPSSPYNTWDDVTMYLEHGYVGTALQFNSFEYFMNDKYRSTVVGKIGYSQNPAGEAGSFSTFGGSGLGVSRYSRNPEAAWLWLQWATSLGAQEAMFLSSFHAFPSRLAVFDESIVKDALLKDGYSAPLVAKKVWDANQVTALVAFPKWAQILNPLSFHLSRAMSLTETPGQALSGAKTQIASWGKLTF